MNGFKKCLSKYLDKKGYVIQRKVLYRREQQLLLDALEIAQQQESEAVLSIVFSKDRAMQLQAFLRSYKQQVSHAGEMCVLYKASDERQRKSYERLQFELSDCLSPKITWIEEQDFRQQLIELMAHTTARNLALYVDDMLFLHPVDYRSLQTFSSLEYIPSLCRGKDMTYSAVLERPIALPEFEETSQPGLFSFPWNQYDYLSDWTYPLGVSGYIYGRDELLALFRCIDFKNPNTLESAMQAYKDMFKKRRGICCEQAACCCVHANRVQNDCDNPAFDYFSIEDLLEQWEQGLQIDLSLYYGRSRNEAYCQKYTFEKR